MKKQAIPELSGTAAQKKRLLETKVIKNLLRKEKDNGTPIGDS